MDPDYRFNLHDDSIPRALKECSGVYRILHADSAFHVSSTKHGRRRLSSILRIGHSGDLYRRIKQYRDGRSGRPALDAFTDEHRGRIIVEVELVDPDEMRVREAELMADHAKEKKRIPRFNTRGEFSTVCKHLGRCFTSELKREYSQGWIVDAAGYSHRLQDRVTAPRTWLY